MLHNNIPMLFQNCKRNKQVKLTTHEIRPQAFPKAEYIGPFEFTLVPDEQHAEEEEKVGRIGGLKMQVQRWVHKLNEVVEG